MSGCGAIVVMGPSGNGKSTLAAALADRLGWRMVEGDAHHPAENIARMARGEPLTDAERAPFLASVAAALAEGPAVAACSALKRAYRDRLRDGAGVPLLFVLADLPEVALRARMEARAGHFMPPSLLASQLAALEPPGPDETALALDGALPVERQVAAVLAHLGAD